MDGEPATFKKLGGKNRGPLRKKAASDWGGEEDTRAVVSGGGEEKNGDEENGQASDHPVAMELDKKVDETDDLNTAVFRDVQGKRREQIEDGLHRKPRRDLAGEVAGPDTPTTAASKSTEKPGVKGKDKKSLLSFGDEEDEVTGLLFFSLRKWK